MPILGILTEIVDPYVIIKVKDNGLGMQESQVIQLLNKFKQFHPGIEGAGVGLYMVKKIIDNSFGKIDVESIECVGSTLNQTSNTVLENYKCSY